MREGVWWRQRDRGPPGIRESPVRDGARDRVMALLLLLGLGLLLLLLLALLLLHLFQLLNPGFASLLPLPTILGTVPPVLDGIVATVRAQYPCNLSPLRANFTNKRLNLLALLLADRRVVEPGLEVLVEAFAALFGRPCAHGIGDLDPVGMLVAFTDEEQKTSILGL